MSEARLRAFAMWFLSVGIAQLTLAEGWMQVGALLSPIELRLAVFGSILAVGAFGCAMALAGTGTARGLLSLLARWRETANDPEAILEAALALDERPGHEVWAVASAGGCLAATCATLGCWSLLFALQLPI